jgi:hypothetical protein
LSVTVMPDQNTYGSFAGLRIPELLEALISLITSLVGFLETQNLVRRVLH